MQSCTVDEIVQLMMDDPNDNKDPAQMRALASAFHEFCTGDQTCKNAAMEILECYYANDNPEPCWQRYVLHIF